MKTNHTFKQPETNHTLPQPLLKLSNNTGNVNIKRVVSSKFLAVSVDERPNWNEHLGTKLYTLNFVSHAKTVLPVQGTLKLYFARFYRSHYICA